MKKFLLLIFVFMMLGACSLSKNTYFNKNNLHSKADKIVANAFRFKGVKYKFGGTTKKGMDCSGVIFVAFNQENIHLPRVTKNMAKRGSSISLNSARKGDLLFFRTASSIRGINHVGLITSIKNEQIWFIHSTSSKGVIISSLSQKYWKKSFVKATRLL